MDLSKLRRSIQQNLRERPLPVDEDLNLEDASESVASSLYDNSRAITVQDALALFRVSQQYLVVDTRVLEEYSTGHVQRSVNVSIPSLLLHRLRKQTTRSGIAGWVSLTRYIGTAAGQALWDSIDLSRPLDLVIVGADADDIEGPFILADILEPLVTSGRVRVLAGGWTALAAQVQAPGLVLSENINQNLIVTRAAASPDRAVPTLNTMLVESPIAAPAPSQTNVPAISSPAVMHPPRFPSLTTTDLNTPRRPPKLQLNMTRSAPAIAIGAVATPQRSVRPKLGGLTIDVGPSRAPAGPHSAFPYPGSATPRAPGGLTVNTAMAKTSSLAPPPGEPWTEASATPIGPAHEFNNLPPPTPIGPGGSSIPEPSPLMRTTTDISTILPSFLFLGPEIATQADVDELLALGVRRILNVAIECDDDEGLGLRTAFEKYYRIPMKDSVDESGVSKGIRDACKILDDARLHSAPTYVHCKAGRSRSVTVVLAYLIHANAWTLHTSYQYVAERRHGISPNIGFVAELMEFETSELGHKQGQQYSSDVDADAENDPPLVRREPRVGPRYTRESLPPEFGSERLGGLSLGFGQLPDDSDSDGSPVDEPEGGAPENHRTRRKPQPDIEVRKNGHWVLRK